MNLVLWLYFLRLFELLIFLDDIFKDQKNGSSMIKKHGIEEKDVNRIHLTSIFSAILWPLIAIIQIVIHIFNVFNEIKINKNGKD